MVTAEIYTSWYIHPEDGRIPEIINDYWETMKSREGGSITDVTGQDVTSGTPDPNVFAVRVRVGDTTLSEIKSDSKYLVLWHE